MSPFSSLPLVHIHLLFCMKFSYIGAFISWLPTHVIYASNEECISWGEIWHLEEKIMIIRVIYKVPQGRPKHGVWCMLETLFCKKLIRASYIWVQFWNIGEAPWTFTFTPKNFKSTLGFDPWDPPPKSQLGQCKAR